MASNRMIADQLFRKWDPKFQGFLTVPVVQECLASIGINFTDGEVYLLVLFFNGSNGMTINWKEFENMFCIIMSASKQTLDAVLFAAIDDDHNGYIDPQEFANILDKFKVKLTREQLINVIHKYGGSQMEIREEAFSRIISILKQQIK